MKLEKLLEKFIPEIETQNFDVIAHGLLHDGDGWTVNDSWFLSRGANKEEILVDARNRWEIFKVNYLPRGRVCDISADGDEKTVYVDCAGIPFLELRKRE
jgi:hypothetical protein